MSREGFILLVEDSPDDAALTMRALKRHNIMNEVIHVKDGAEALEFIYATGAYAGRDPALLPVFVMLDLKLPRVDGMEVLRRIRGEESTAMLPVVIFTSSSEERDLVEGYSLGVNSYVRKPVEFEEFAEAVR